MEELPDSTKRAMLQERLENLKQQAFSQLIDIEFTGAQGTSDAEKGAAKKAANGLRKKRVNLLKGIAQVEEMLEELPSALKVVKDA